MDKVSGKELSKKFKDRDDKDDNDGTPMIVMVSPQRRQTIQKMDTEGNKFTGALMSAKKNGKDHFMVSGKKYAVKKCHNVCLHKK